MPVTADQYATQQYTEMERRLARKRQGEERRALEGLAATGGIGGGAQNARMREVGQDIGEQWHQASSDIEATRLAATEAQRQREWGTGEREGAQTWQTGERTGSETAQSALAAQNNAARSALQAQVDAGLMTRQEAEQEWSTGEREGTQLYETGERVAGQEYATGERLGAQEFTAGLQAQAEAAASDLQAQIDDGRMTLQQAEQAWTEIQADLNRQQQTALQTQSETAQLTQVQWEAQFGSEAALALQRDGQTFEQAMAAQARDWEIADRAWQEQMWTMDAQLQMTVAGWDWNEDGVAGGAPAWVFEGTNIGEEEGAEPVQNPSGPGPNGEPASAGRWVVAASGARLWVPKGGW